MAMNIRSFFLLMLCMCAQASAFFDNRFIPFLERPFITVPDRPSHANAELFVATASTAFGENDDFLGIYELYGNYDLRDIAKGLKAIGKPNPLRPSFQGIDLPWTVEGRIQAQGMNFAYQQRVVDWLSVGFYWYFMRVIGRQSFFITRNESLRLTLPEQQELDADRRLMQEELGLTGPLSDRSGMGDLDLYVKFGGAWDYALKFRRIEAGLRLGALVPVGLRRDINNPASIPFGGNGHVGAYASAEAEFELKEDWKVGLWLRLSQRFSRVCTQRLAVGKEPYIYGPVVGPALVEPGINFTFLPYLMFENLRDGFGARILYTLTVHARDEWRDARADRTIAINTKDADKHSEWASDYFTLNVFYDFGKVKVIRNFEPILMFAWDIPASLIVGKNVSKTNRITLGFEFSF